MQFSLALLALFSVGAHSAASIRGLENSKAVPDSFIVVLKPSISDEALTSHFRWADGVLKSKSGARKSAFAFKAFKGYHLQASATVASLLAESEEVGVIPQ